MLAKPWFKEKKSQWRLDTRKSLLALLATFANGFPKHLPHTDSVRKKKDILQLKNNFLQKQTSFFLFLSFLLGSEHPTKSKPV